jgi:hypothetical protein
MFFISLFLYSFVYICMVFVDFSPAMMGNCCCASLQSVDHFLEGSLPAQMCYILPWFWILWPALVALPSDRNVKFIETSNTERMFKHGAKADPFPDVKTRETQQAGQALWKQLRSEYFEVCVEAGQSPGHVPQPRGRGKNIANCGYKSGAIPGSVTC